MSGKGLGCLIILGCFIGGALLALLAVWIVEWLGLVK